MAIITNPLRKILALESKKGYPNTAVIGGLDCFLRQWNEQAGPAIADLKTARRFQEVFRLRSGYAALTVPQRQEWAGKALLLLDELDKIISAPLKPAGLRMTARPPAQRSGVASKQSPRVKKPAAKVCKTAPAKIALEAPVTAVKGINEAFQKKFHKLGVTTIRELLYFFPHRHIDYSQRHFISQLTEGEEHTIIANVWEASEVRLGTRRGTEAIVGDETGNMRIVWFNQPYLARSLKTGSRIVVSGKISLFNGRPQFDSPEWEIWEADDKDLVHTGRLIPVYPLTEGIGQRQVRRIMKSIVDEWACQLTDFLPQELRQRLKIPELSEAIRQAHYPDSPEEKDRARIRLAFDELFLLQLGVYQKKRLWQEKSPGHSLKVIETVLEKFLASLPYKLTSAQERVLKEILEDLQKTKPMARLLQGEVGSGKTVVAAVSLLMTVANGFQGAFMAPTEILAEQHFKSLRTLLSSLGPEEGEGCIFSYSGLFARPITLALLTGDIKQLKKEGVRERIRNGEIDLAIGTHALIQKDVEFHKLGLAVIDEQHRFGVDQRSGLRQKGTNPHILVMTATPIPRTLALTLYGDLDLSVIDQLPPGRQLIKTKWLQPEQRKSAYDFIRKQVAEGRQAYIICPLVDESETIQARAAVTEFEFLSQQVFPELRLGLLHGRMSSQDKDTTMQRFHAGELDILVSTPVIEVGIDVSNATVMLIESADRFGLSQLHQFRGRVGRGRAQSYCILLAEKPSEIGLERLRLIEKIHNGFELAEEDLKLRGPGEFFGTRQSGLPDLKMARLSDVALLELARNEADVLFKADPELERVEHRQLAAEMARVWKQQINAEWS